MCVAAVKAGATNSSRRYRSCTYPMPFKSVTAINQFFRQAHLQETLSQLIVWAAFVCQGRRATEVMPLLAGRLLGPEVRRLCKDAQEPDQVLPIGLVNVICQILANVKEKHPLLEHHFTWEEFMKAVGDVDVKPRGKKRRLQ